MEAKNKEHKKSILSFLFFINNKQSQNSNSHHMMWLRKIIDLVLLDFIYNEMLLILFLSLTHSSHQVARSTCEHIGEHGHTHKNTSKTIDIKRGGEKKKDKMRFFHDTQNWLCSYSFLNSVEKYFFFTFSVVLVPARREISYFSFLLFFFATSTRLSE